MPDAGRIAPPVTPEGTRAGHDISVEVHLDAGVPVESLESRTHDVAIERPNPRQAVVKLRDKAVIPNKDFILKYAVAGHRVEDAVLTHTGYFTLLLQPPDRVQPEEIAPKELVFVLDTSGSMSGFPIEKAKEAMGLALDGLHPRDTFNLITFAGDTHILFPNPVPATAGEPPPGARVSECAVRQRRHRNDEGHTRIARPQRCAGTHARSLLHDRWRGGQ